MLRARPLEEKADAVQAFAREVVPQLAAGRVKPLVDRVFPADEAAAAFDRLEGPGSSARCCWTSAGNGGPGRLSSHTAS